MLEKINNIKLMLETLRDDVMANDINTKDILKVSQQLEEIIKEDYGLKEMNKGRESNYTETIAK